LIVAIKSVHSAIFVAETVAIAVLLYCAVTATYGRPLTASLAAISVEVAAMVIFRGRCPLTALAERAGAEHGAVSDLFCPQRLVPYIFGGFAALLALCLLLLAFNLGTGR
jgi:hypothetical protein